MACRFIAAPPLAARLPGGAETGDRPGSGRIGDSGDGPIGPSLAVARVPADRWLALPAVGSWVEHDLSELLALLQAFMCDASFAQRKGPIDHWLQPLAEHVFQHFVQIAHRPHIGTEE